MGRVVGYHDQYLGLPPGDAGVKLTIAQMENLALGKEGALNPEVRVSALNATKYAADRDDLAQATALYDSVKESIRFRGEYSETVQTPLVTLQVRAGDCDDHATLIAALLRSIGIPARFKTVATDPTDPKKEFSHVYALAGIRKGNRIVQWLPMDTTVPYASAGWEVPKVTRAKVWGGLSGLGVTTPGDGDTPPTVTLSPKATDAVALITAGGQAISQNIAAFRNTGNTTTASFMRTPNGAQGNIGTSPTVLVVGGLAAAGALLMLLRKR